MTEGIKVMNELGYINTIDKRDGDLVRQFKKYDDKGYITDTINYFYTNDDISVFTNNIQRGGCGSRLDRDLLNAIQLNYDELESDMKQFSIVKAFVQAVVDFHAGMFDAFKKGLEVVNDFDNIDKENKEK